MKTILIDSKTKKRIIFPKPKNESEKAEFKNISKLAAASGEQFRKAFGNV